MSSEEGYWRLRYEQFRKERAGEKELKPQSKLEILEEKLPPLLEVAEKLRFGEILQGIRREIWNYGEITVTPDMDNLTPDTPLAARHTLRARWLDAPMPYGTSKKGEKMTKGMYKDRLRSLEKRQEKGETWLSSDDQRLETLRRAVKAGWRDVWVPSQFRIISHRLELVAEFDPEDEEKIRVSVLTNMANRWGIDNPECDILPQGVWRYADDPEIDQWLEDMLLLDINGRKSCGITGAPYDSKCLRAFPGVEKAVETDRQMGVADFPEEIRLLYEQAKALAAIAEAQA